MLCVVAASNIEAARAATRDLATMFEYFDEDISWEVAEVTAPADLAVNVRGREAARQIIESWVGTWLDYAFEVDDLDDIGDVALLAVTRSARAPALAAEPAA
jgi:ketosteroid isomerase-like protein